MSPCPPGMTTPDNLRGGARKGLREMGGMSLPFPLSVGWDRNGGSQGGDEVAPLDRWFGTVVLLFLRLLVLSFGPKAPDQPHGIRYIPDEKPAFPLEQTVGGTRRAPQSREPGGRDPPPCFEP